MDLSGFVHDTLMLRNTEVPVLIGELPHSSLQYFPENPRLYSIIAAYEKVPDQDVIQEKLIKMDHVKRLIQSIKVNGGLTDPIIVRKGDWTVLEGNSRLAAYRALNDQDPRKWAKIKVKVLPEDIDDKLIFALLGEYHIVGRKDWQPYEQAGYLYRRHKKHGISLEVMASEMGLSLAPVKHLVRVYEFMIENGENKVNRWSYWDEYLKSRDIGTLRVQFPELDHIVINKVKCGEISRAVDIRDKLKVVAKAGNKSKKGKKIVQKMIKNECTLDEAHDRATSMGAGNQSLERIDRFRKWLGDSDVESDILETSDEILDKTVYSLRQLSKIVIRLKDRLSDN